MKAETVALKALEGGRNSPLWMAPALQENSTFWRLVGCSLLSGLLMQPLETAGPDGVGERGPNLLIRL
jgi:hypothetical protein